MELFSHLATGFGVALTPVNLLYALVAFCALVFVKGLGLPVPLIGPWFGA